MAEPALRTFQEQFHGRLMTRSRLRDMIGPDNPTFQLLESLCIVSESVFEDEFWRTLDTGTWAVNNSTGSGVANFAHSAALPNGQIEGDAGTDTDADAQMLSVGTTWQIDQRPVLLTRLEPRTAIAENKFEVGFASADAVTGQVLVKDTPTSTGADYCVVVRDTIDDTSIDMVMDGTTPTIASTNLVAGTHGVTWTVSTMHNIMLAMNELDEQFFWVNGSLGGAQRRNVGPDNDIALGLWLSTVNRGGDAHPLRCDYMKVLSERVLL